MATAAMRPGPPEPSCRRPPRRQPRLTAAACSLQAIFVLLLAAAPYPTFGNVSGAAFTAAAEQKIQPRNASRAPLNLTVGYLPAVRGDLNDRKGLAISGAISIALEEVSSKNNFLLTYTIYIQSKSISLITCVYIFFQRKHTQFNLPRIDSR